jgi:2-amino-4-hydroxy-6-hydroxymethyldihydropteridine diphosphokinase
MHIKRELNESLTTFKSLEFGSNHFFRSSKRYRATIGVGGNVGDVKRRFKHLLVTMQRDMRVDVVQTSLILKNPPFGYADQDDFFNSIIVLQVNMQARALLSYLLRLEKKFARKRSFANAPRTLDLDIIFFDNRVIKTDELTIPHAHWSERESVVVPLASTI